MSIESATQRLNAALGGLEAKVARRIEGLHAENDRPRQEQAALKIEAGELRQALAVAQAAASPAAPSAALAALEQRNADYRATLAKTLQNLDNLITRVESAAQ